jgi:hypothetical protein
MFIHGATNHNLIPITKRDVRNGLCPHNVGYEQFYVMGCNTMKPSKSDSDTINQPRW